MNFYFSSIFQFSCCLFLSLQFIRRNRPKTISYEEALEQVKQEQRWQISKESSLHYSETAFQKRFLSLWKTWILRVDFLFCCFTWIKTDRLRHTLTSRIRKPYGLSRPVCETIFDSVFNIERLSSSLADDKPLSKEASLWNGFVQKLN